MDGSVFDRNYFHGRRKSNYDDYSKSKLTLSNLAKVLYTNFRPASSFDAGGAYGHLVHGLRRRGVKAWGMDISSYAVNHSPFMRQGDICTLTDSQRYDLVTCTDVLEHIPEHLLEQALKGLWGITGKHLVLIIALESHALKDRDKTHITMRPRQWWEEKFAKLGYPSNPEKEKALNNNRLCRKMGWTGRIFVLQKEGS